MPGCLILKDQNSNTGWWSNRSEDVKLKYPRVNGSLYVSCAGHKSSTRCPPKDVYTMFIATLFRIAPNWKQPKCSSTAEWINKWGCSYAIEYCSSHTEERAAFLNPSKLDTFTNRTFTFIFYCYITNYHKQCSLKQHPLINSQFWRSEVQAQNDWLASLLRVLEGWNQGVGWAVFSSGGSGEGFASELIQVIGWILFLAVVGLRSLLTC